MLILKNAFLLLRWLTESHERKELNLELLSPQKNKMNTNQIIVDPRSIPCLQGEKKLIE